MCYDYSIADSHWLHYRWAICPWDLRQKDMSKLSHLSDICKRDKNDTDIFTKTNPKSYNFEFKFPIFLQKSYILELFLLFHIENDIVTLVAIIWLDICSNFTFLGAKSESNVVL